ncbi:MAG TPA: ATP-grasp domain-containing protein [Clostridia bacterium]
MNFDDFFILQGLLPVIVKKTGIGIYDFNFRDFMECKSILGDINVPAVLRIGAVSDYHKLYNELKEQGIELIHTSEEFNICTMLPNWYPLIKDVTPKSIWYDILPTAEQVEDDIGWPVFVKGAHQTSRHKKALSIIEGPLQFERLLELWKSDPILHWQPMVCREYVKLQLVEDVVPDRIQSSLEFRIFIWKCNIVGIGRYWWNGIHYDVPCGEMNEVSELALLVAKRLNVTFLVVDIAKTEAGNWIVIEVNDAQESGYAGVSPIYMWQKIIEMEI